MCNQKPTPESSTSSISLRCNVIARGKYKNPAAITEFVAVPIGNGVTVFRVFISPQKQYPKPRILKGTHRNVESLLKTLPRGIRDRVKKLRKT